MPVPNLPTSGATFAHIKECETVFPTLNAAHDLWMNSLRIPLEQLSFAAGGAHADGVNPEAPDAEAPDAADTDAEAALAGGAPLGVHLLLKVGASPSVEEAECSLKIQVSPDCTKEFEFKPGAQVRIPVSVARPTAVTVTCQQATATLSVENFLVDLRNKTNTVPDRIVMKAKPLSRIPEHMVYTKVQTPDKTLAFKFPCFQYHRDAEFPISDYDIRRMTEDVTALQENPVVLPSELVKAVSMKDAQCHLASLEYSWQQLESALKDCQLFTAVEELGASADEAPDLAARVNWHLSYCVPKDSAMSEAINLTRSIYHKLTAVSNMAIAPSEAAPAAKDSPAGDVSIEVSKAVNELVQTRAQLATALQTRRKDLTSVIQVRTNFLAIQAIDDALRSAYSVQRAPRSTDGSFVADSIACYDYWLGQMKSNTHNSIRMTDDTFDAARGILANCQRVRDSGARLAPACDVKLSRLGCKVWENMLLQGITIAHPLMAASAPHVLYKKRTLLDYAKHPFLKALEGRHCTANQVESAKLLAILVSHDVEHRIITPALEDSIILNFALASRDDASTNDAERIEAEKKLLTLFNAPMQSLVASALGKSPKPDLNFLTDAAHMPPTTGYDMVRVTAFCLDRVLELQ
jgi:hypothetical protein